MGKKVDPLPSYPRPAPDPLPSRPMSFDNPDSVTFLRLSGELVFPPYRMGHKMVGYPTSTLAIRV